LGDSSGGAFDLDLPTASGISGKVLRFKKVSSDLTAITIDPDGAETIDGGATKKLFIDGETLGIVSDGTNWRIIQWDMPGDYLSWTPTFNGFGTPTNVFFRFKPTRGSLHIIAHYNCGTSTAATASFTLPGSFLTKTATTQRTNGGHYSRGGSGGTAFINAKGGSIIIDDSVSTIVFSSFDQFGSSTMNPNGSVNGNAVCDNASNIIAFSINVPVAELGL
jgi:hypothetical protein